MDSLAEGIFAVDKEFRIIFFNQAAEKITGLEAQDVRGKLCKQVFNTRLCETDCPIAKVLSTGENVFDLETKFYLHNSKSFKAKVNAAILKNTFNEPVGGIVSFRDLNYLLNIDSYLPTKNYYGVIGHSKAMLEIFEVINEIAETDASVFIHGETGTGKELVANAIQETSRRKNEKFVKVNCSVIPPSLFASELFGHIKGAFTNAVADRVGRFELADKGTIFLDEIAEMPLNMQTQLLRVLQDGTFERVGESVTRKVDVRVIAATNQNIREAISSGKFREDLYFRLNIIPLEVPPLRNRKEDIPFLVKHFIQKFNQIHKKNIIDIEKDALDILLQHDWFGNIRELENTIEYSIIRAKRENLICKCCLPPPIINQLSKNKCKEEMITESGKIDFERLMTILEENKWNKTNVAKLLGVDRTTLWRYLKKYNNN
ncbi:MAG: sigma 54-interacting transcriptional regulator [Bacteroidetes bacterium]|nr:sigma 54-interacting transcriptional regulator [Bacteroidota bacterium]